MISRLFMKLTPRILRPAKRCMSEHHPVMKQQTMNDIPIPHEPFETGYKRRQMGNNTVLIGGITFFTLSFYYVFNSGVIFLNLTPPRKILSNEMAVRIISSEKLILTFQFLFQDIIYRASYCD